MGDVKKIAEKIFSPQQYDSLVVKLSVKNITAQTEISDTPVIRKSLHSSIRIGNTKALELLEFNDDYVLIGSTVQIGSLGHHLEMKVTVLEDKDSKKKLYAFKSDGKISMFEKKQIDGLDVFLIYFSFQKGDKKHWDEINAIFSSKQDEISRLFMKLKGIE